MVRYFFGLEGRLGRIQFWKRSFQAYMICLLAVVAAMLMGSAINQQILLIAAAVPIAAAAILTSVSLGVRRLHDRGKSGWWMLLYGPINVLGMVLGSISPPSSGLVLVFLGIGVLLVLWVTIELGFLPGTSGENAYDTPRV